MTLIERLIALGVLGGGAYALFAFDVVNFEGNELTVYPVRCLESWGEFQGMPKCEAEDTYTHILDAEAGEMRIKTDNPDAFVVRESCKIDSDDNWICPTQSREILPGRPAILGPILCTTDELKAGKCDIEKNTVQDFGAVTSVFPLIAVTDGKPLRNGTDCFMDRYFVGALQWLAVRGAEAVGRISLWPADQKECEATGF
ncbi:MAG: hypothetical protein IIA05_10910 [Proteobacteria bacterium]|nr:hypothetical protein [Pseudomonadota bacterium]